MSLWDKLQGPRTIAKKIGFIYEPYRKAKVAYVSQKRNKYLKDNGMRLIMEVDKILENTAVCFFVDCGTLLGLVRNGELIQWDLDIDFGIYITSGFSWSDLEAKLKSIGLILDHQFRYKNEITEQTYKRGPASVDFFNHFDDISNSHFYAYYTKKGYAYKNESQMHVEILKTRRLSGMKKMDVDGGYVYVPIEAEGYLADIYGEMWRIPDPNWKQGSGPACIELGDNELGIIEKF